jgi:tRNA nucleotidyltransferase (CCA-adding enzyme)
MFISKKALDILKTAGRAGDLRGLKVYAAGGFVRDALLGEDNLDIDIVVEGDGIEFAKDFVKNFNADLIVHECFGTASIKPKIAESRAKRPLAGIKIDIATARSERYKSPGAYPTVKADTIKNDLKRRDFTINAMAISLNAKGFLCVLDFFKGRSDLRHGIIRVLHDRSFIDDPTRIFRAVRFEQRYGFRIERHTKKLIIAAVEAGMLGRIKKQRLEKEEALIHGEKKALKMLARIKEFTG